MTKINKIITSQIEARETSDRNDANSYAWEPNGTINYHDSNSIGRKFLAPGIVYGANYDSGDGNSRHTIKLIPDNDLINNGNSYNEDQYVIIDPTDPNHIHLRAGGTQDASSADIFLGGEYNHVRVSDFDREVVVKSKQQQQSMAHANINTETSEYLITTDVVSATNGWTIEANGETYSINAVESDTPVAGQTTIYAPNAGFQPNGVYNVFSPVVLNMWEFNTDGFLYGPAEDALIQVAGIKGSSYSPIAILGPHSVVLDGNDGEFLNDSSNPDNQIAKIGDLTEDSGKAFQAVRWSPNFEATGLAFSGEGATYPTYNSHYVKQGQLVSFWIAIDLSTVTDFGTGQLKTALPFAPLAGTMNHFSGWVNVDETANPDLAGHIIVNADHLSNTSVLDLHYIKQSGGANSPVMEAMLKQDTPVELTTATNIYVNGTYIAAS